MLRLKGHSVTVARGDAARQLAQRTVFSARRVLPEFTDVATPQAVQRCAQLLRHSLGEPSYTVNRPLDGPIEIWVVSLKNGNGILSFELWLHNHTPRYYIFTDRPSPVMAKVLKKLHRYLYGDTVTPLPTINSKCP